MTRKPPTRTTEDVHLTLPRALAEEVKARAQRLGFTISEYVIALVKGQPPVGRPGAEMQDVSLAGNRIVRAIGALQQTPAQVDDAVRLLREAQRFIAAALSKAQPAYEAAVAAQVATDSWGEADPR